ncbi:MAG: hypothetical protein OEX76_03860 [Candidatus Bathyarchaeota archaeon]|nr:hypothetical protein [Candidatus Bathyarchaeota archaeon]MDH5532557.1 hypothetical protein [Candidatus Bathyarchaeota archaeon]MDH5713247.1 hypothetical protein [Candidatus Bathyarchaeota archaeon]
MTQPCVSKSPDSKPSKNSRVPSGGSGGYTKTSADLDWEDYQIADTRGPEDPPGSGDYPPDGQVDMWDFGYCGLEYEKSFWDP